MPALAVVMIGAPESISPRQRPVRCAQPSHPPVREFGAVPPAIGAGTPPGGAACLHRSLARAVADRRLRTDRRPRLAGGGGLIRLSGTGAARRSRARPPAA